MTAQPIPVFRAREISQTMEILTGQVMARLVKKEQSRLDKPRGFRKPQPVRTDTRDRILKFVSVNPGSTAAGIVEGAGVTRNAVNQSLLRMIDTGILRREGPMPYRYFAETGQ